MEPGQEERTSTPCETVKEEDEEAPVEDKKIVEKREEEKLKAKYPSLNKGGVGSALLHKRLQKGQKYFDSGDYAMAKARMSAQQEKKIPNEEVGETIATPENIPARNRKSSLLASKLALGELLG